MASRRPPDECTPGYQQWRPAMPLFNTALWTNAIICLSASACAALVRLGPRLFPTSRAGLIWRESLAIPLYMAAALYGMRLGVLPQDAAPLLTAALALLGPRRLERVALRYILRK
ncbi:hypothetical protein ACFS32_07695 [Novosphingobium pokkalii]